MTEKFIDWLRENHDAIHAAAAAGKLSSLMKPEQFMQAVEEHAALIRAGRA